MTAPATALPRNAALHKRSDGAQMPGMVTLADNGFNFKLYGGPPDDRGWISRSEILPFGRRS